MGRRMGRRMEGGWEGGRGRGEGGWVKMLALNAERARERKRAFKRRLVGGWSAVEGVVTWTSAGSRGQGTSVRRAVRGQEAGAC
eukprot:1802313-Rhodomonas_salina.1